MTGTYFLDAEQSRTRNALSLMEKIVAAVPVGISPTTLTDFAAPGCLAARGCDIRKKIADQLTVWLSRTFSLC
jgi:hypothetical protein